MKIFLLPGFFLVLFACGPAAEVGTVKKPVSVAEKDTLLVDWAAGRTPVEIREGPVVIGFDTTAGWFRPVKEQLTKSVKEPAGREVRGFRIQIYLTPVKNKADEVAAEARNSYGFQVYSTFNAPNYLIRIGNYVTREDAVLALEKISEIYPNASIVPDFIKK